MRVQIVSFHCVLKNELGEFISSSFNHDVVTTPSSSPHDAEEVLPGFIAGLHGLKEGERKKISVKAKEAYGFYDETLLMKVSRSEISHGRRLKKGDLVRAILGKSRDLKNYRVMEANPLELLLDGNHPLAGQDLVFDVEVTSLREENETQDEWVPSKILN